MPGYKVELSVGKHVVIFEASSPVSESRTANYDGFGIIHLPTDLWAYRNTSGRKFAIQGKLVSRTVEEAAQNTRYLDLVRSWLLPDFGGSGATPPIIMFSAYNHDNIYKVPCVMKSYSFQFPDEVDYIFDENKPWLSAMPIIGLLGIELDEAYSAQQIRKKAWKIHVAEGGSFKYSEQIQIAETPDVSNVDEGFAGIAAQEVAAVEDLKSIAATTAAANPVNKTPGLLDQASSALGKIKDTMASGYNASIDAIKSIGSSTSKLPSSVESGSSSGSEVDVGANASMVTSNFSKDAQTNQSIPVNVE